MLRESQPPLKIDELVRLVRVHGGPHRKVFAMLAAYLDESGIHDGAELCVIGGYFGGIGQWKKFEGEWRKLLHKYSIPLDEFHAKDLVNRRDPQTKQLLDGLADVIAHYKIHPVCQGIMVEDFNSFTEPQRKFFTGAVLEGGKLRTSGCPSKPYFAAFQHCVKRIAGYTPVNIKVNLFFGLDRPFAGYATVLLQDLAANAYVSHDWTRQLGVPAFPKASETPQLQAADLLVHLVYKDMLKRRRENTLLGLAPPHTLLRKCLQKARAIREDVVYFTKHTMEDLLRQTYESQGHWDGTA